MSVSIATPVVSEPELSNLQTEKTLIELLDLSLGTPEVIPHRHNSKPETVVAK